MLLEKFLEILNLIPRLILSDKLKALKDRLKVKIRLAQVKAARALAESIPEAIKIRTRLEGQDAKGKSLKSLSKPYIEYRSLAPDLSSDTTPETSNLTATGQLLDSIKGKNVGSRVVIEPGKAKRKGELYGKKSTLTNKQVNAEVDKGGREFLALSPQERKEVEELAREIIAEELRSVIK